MYIKKVDCDTGETIKNYANVIYYDDNKIVYKENEITIQECASESEMFTS